MSEKHQVEEPLSSRSVRQPKEWICPFCTQTLTCSWGEHFRASLPPSCSMDGSFEIHENCDGVHCSFIMDQWMRERGC